MVLRVVVDVFVTVPVEDFVIGSLIDLLLF
jgi:hypothetical protein